MDTIAAIATAAGRGAVAMVRISGRDAHAIAARLIPGFQPQPERQIRTCRVLHPATGELLDQATHAVYHGPRSYTGEDTVEIFTHGGPFVSAGVLEALLAAGARHARPGEFTFRAVLNGRMDLIQAEAVADLIDADVSVQRRAALDQLDRNLSRRVLELRQQVLDLEVLVSYDVDFPEEDDGPVPAERISAAAQALHQALAQLLATAPEGERIRHGAVAVIAGRPNAGKSSLFNALLGTDRAIVTDVPGTTRDAIEATASCAGFPFRLVDTAGLRDSSDPVERLGIEVSHRYLGAADLVLYCADSAREVAADERAFIASLSAPVLLVRTRSDLAPTAGAGIAVSAVTGDGMATLREIMARTAFAHASETGPGGYVMRERQRLGLSAALSEVDLFLSARAEGLDAVVAATHLRAAATALEDLIGVVTGAEVLDRLFGAFCVGK